MRKFLLTVVFLFFVSLPFFVSPSPAMAASCAGNGIHISIEPPIAPTKDESVTATITVNITDISVVDQSKMYYVYFSPGLRGAFGTQTQPLHAGENIFTVVVNKGNNANYSVTLKEKSFWADPVICEDVDYRADNTSSVSATTGTTSTTGPAADAAASFCKTDSGVDGTDTTLGCIPAEPAELVKWILKYAILMGGGIAFLLSIWGGATILLSAGNPEKINEGRDVIVSAISGLLFIVFSVFLLRLIGVDILGLPGFSAQ